MGAARIQVELDAGHAEILAHIAAREHVTLEQAAARSIVEHLGEHERAAVMRQAIGHVAGLDADMLADFATRYPVA